MVVQLEGSDMADMVIHIIQILHTIRIISRILIIPHIKERQNYMLKGEEEK